MSTEVAPLLNVMRSTLTSIIATQDLLLEVRWQNLVDVGENAEGPSVGFTVLLHSFNLQCRSSLPTHG